MRDDLRVCLFGLALLSFVISIVSPIQAQTSHNPLVGNTLAASVEQYKTRYPLPDVFAKLVDNRGKGRPDLEGVRNFRAVLPGLIYRGGANNSYRVPKLSHTNPLPPEGLVHLCEQDFSQAIYMYSDNFSAAAPTTQCQAGDGHSNALHYEQDSALSSSNHDAAIKRIFTIVRDRIIGTDHRPVFLHCWNGWHASGYASALVLRQFCQVSGEVAAKYWDRNRDKVSVPSEKNIMKRIRNFQPLPGFAISEEQRAAVCPAL